MCLDRMESMEAEMNTSQGSSLLQVCECVNRIMHCCHDMKDESLTSVCVKSMLDHYIKLKLKWFSSSQKKVQKFNSCSPCNV